MHMKASQLSFRDRTHEFQSVADSASGPSSRSKSEINIILIDVVEREVDVGAVGAGDYFGSGSTAEEVVVEETNGMGIARSPGIGTISSPCWRTQARASCAGEHWCFPERDSIRS
ncbi:hypothetical protein F8388_002749 [Cannabis sativa]|uniref:Syntaxin-5 N-terminal Sly1p-binding domain-containing protein n=1 Tax=Cannabis sativa TaxID=3483 RepID=A0A7J6F7Q0_CANSA|nr:hypothetical protein F8388_002749 [Cannabis sativa]